MLTETQIQEGLKYAENNFQNENAVHLHIDKKLIRELFDLNGKKVLDFGCGMGGMTLWYASNWKCEITGVDIDGHHIEIANRLKEKYKADNVRFLKKNILDGLFPEKFDFIFMNDVAEHIAIPILEDIFIALKQSLAPGGKLFVTYPPWKSPYASHVNQAVKIPWCQFLPDSMLLPMIEKNNISIIGEEESDLLSAYKGLNHLTHTKLMKVAKTAGFTQVYRKSHCILNRFSMLKNVPFRFFPFDYLITKEFLLLQ